MALVLADRVQETTTTTGTTDFALGGAVTGYKTFLAGVGNTNTCYYSAFLPNSSEWEVGIGTVGSGGAVLARTTILSSSTGSKVSFSAGQKFVFVTYPATKSVNLDAANDVTLPGNLIVPTQASLQATTLTRPSIRPSLLLDFANTKQLDPRITFSRPTTATYYDGKTVVKAEENLQIQSQFALGWSLSSVTSTVNSTTAPDGTSTANTLTASSGTGITPRTFLASALTGINGTVYTASVYAKAGTNNYLQIAALAGSVCGNFDLSLGVVGYSNAATNTITPIGSGWYRCSITFTSASTDLRPIFIIVPNATTAWWPTWNPVGTESIYLWGAQLEQRSTVTAYTPTTTAPITNYIPVLLTAAAGVARFDHNPVTGESKGLLIEEQRTNLLTYSEQFDNAAWVKTNGSITANTIVAPDGTLTGDTLTDTLDGSATSHLVNTQLISLTNGTAYTISVYVKAGSLPGMSFVFPNTAFTSFLNARFNVSSGVVASLDSGLTATITPVGNGWYRCTATATATATTTGSFQIRTATTSTSFYQGTGFGYIYIWGAQLETGSFPTSYIPTVASQVTRSADSASMTGSNFSSWYRADEGTGYVEMSGANSSNTYGAVIGNGTAAERIVFAANTLRVVASGTDQCNISSGAFTSYTFFKSAGVYKANDFAISVNGGAVATDTSGSVSVPTMLFIGNNGAGAAMNITIKRIAYYPKRLSNTELQGLTS